MQRDFIVEGDMASRSACVPDPLARHPIDGKEVFDAMIGYDLAAHGTGESSSQRQRHCKYIGDRELP